MANTDNNLINIMNLITRDYTHKTQKHVDVSDVQMMEKLQRDDKKSVSRFYDDADSDAFIIRAVLDAEGDIMNWVKDPNQSDDYPLSVPVLASELQNSDHLGVGFTYDDKNIIREYTSDTLMVVLRKDAEAPYGFGLLTAYPLMDKNVLEPTHRNINKVMTQTRTYQYASPCKKAFLDYQTHEHSNTRVSYQSSYQINDDAIMVYADNPDGETVDIVKLKNGYTCVYTGKQRETDEDISTRYDKVPNVYTRLRDGMERNSSKNADMRDTRVQKCYQEQHPEETNAVKILKSGIKKHNGGQFPERDSYKSRINYQQRTFQQHNDKKNYIPRSQRPSPFDVSSIETDDVATLTY